MSFRNDRFELRLATREDGEQILRIYESGEFEGNISVLYTRRPNPYDSLLKEGEQIVMPVIYDREAGMIIGVGCCLIRKAYIGGVLKRTGYLTGLKLLPEYRKKIPYISQVYQYLYEQTKSLVDYYYTTILLENVPVQKMLEKKRKNMPVYDLQGVYTVYCFRTGKRARRVHPHGFCSNGAISSATEYQLEQGKLEEAKAFYKNHIRDWDLFPDTGNLRAFPAESIYTLKDAAGETIAACVLWNQQGHKQYIITDYKGLYRYIQHVPLHWLGYPDLPKRGQPANYANYHMLCVKDNNLNVADYFIRKIAEVEKDYDFLMLGLFQDHPYNSIMRRMKHIKYQSKFYSVYWEKPTAMPDKAKLRVDVSLL
jgi:hypothetical protein